jgi:hypothetical protein
MKNLYTALLWALFSQISFAQVPFSFNEGGSEQSDYLTRIPYEKVNEKIILSVQIQGKSYKFILDTGAPTAITPALFQALHPTLLAQIPVSDANGKRDSLTVVRLPPISAGGIDFKDIPALLMEDNVVFNCLQADGIVGSNLLRNAVLQVDSRTREIILTDMPQKLDLKSKKSSDLMLDKQSNPIISIYLKNKKKVKEQLLLDLGMDGLYDLSLSHFHLFQKNEIFTLMGRSKGSNQMGLFGIAQDTLQYRLQIPQMEINGIKFANVSTQTTTDDNSRIGSAILDYGVITLDYKNRKFYFEPFQEEGISGFEEKFPIDILPRNNQLFIGFVWDEALAGKVAVGDQILYIDDLSFEQVSICDLIVKKSVLKEKKRVKLVTKNAQGEISETVINKN